MNVGATWPLGSDWSRSNERLAGSLVARHQQAWQSISTQKLDSRGTCSAAAPGSARHTARPQTSESIENGEPHPLGPRPSLHRFQAPDLPEYFRPRERGLRGRRLHCISGRRLQAAPSSTRSSRFRPATATRSRARTILRWTRPSAAAHTPGP